MIFTVVFEKDEERVFSWRQMDKIPMWDIKDPAGRCFHSERLIFLDQIFDQLRVHWIASLLLVSQMSTTTVSAI